MLSAQFAAPLPTADIDQPGGFSSIPSLTCSEPPLLLAVPQLCVRSERPRNGCSRTTEKGNEVPPLHLDHLSASTKCRLTQSIPKRDVLRRSKYGCRCRSWINRVTLSGCCCAAISTPPLSCHPSGTPAIRMPYAGD